MRKNCKSRVIGTLLATLFLAGSLFLSSCNLPGSNALPTVVVESIQKTYSDEASDVFTVFYSDGTTSDFQVENQKQPLSAQAAYEHYISLYGDITYADFLKVYFDGSSTQTQPSAPATNDASNINKNLLSSMKVYTFFSRTVTGYIGFRPTTTTETVTFAGSAVIYDMEDTYTYILTNYHVIYYYYGNTKISQDIHAYLYGSEYTPSAVSKNSDGTTNYEFGGIDVPCEYIGGSPSADIAVLRAKTADILSVNPDMHAVSTSDTYYVGQEVIAIGNSSDEGISATKGIVSVADEFINLSVDGTTRTYRSVRIDAAIYNGNSGGGLFNTQGQLIGITNSGEGSSGQNINYAIPSPIVTGIADNIIYYYKKSGMGTPKVVTFGVNIHESNVRYAYDASLGYGRSTAKIELTASSGLALQAGLQTGDVLTAITINGKTHALYRSYNISDLAMTVREGDKLSFTYSRNGVSFPSPIVTVGANDLSTYS